MKSKNKSSGFSLIELSVAIVVLGFIIYTAMAIFTERSAIERVAVTERKMDVIEDAIRIYFLENGDLPCPADGELALDDTAFGTEDCAVDNFGVVGLKGGTIPVRSLNLPDAQMFDGWGMRFTYYASDVATGGSLGDGDIVVNDNTPNEITDKAAYVLISHGEDKIGAWQRNGGATREPRTATTSAHEIENAHVALDGDYETPNNIFRDDIINNETATSAADYFDDIVRWKTKGIIDYDADRLP